VENRAGEPCANPYLAIAAQLYAGLSGHIGARQPAGPPAPGERAAGRLPQSLDESLEAFRSGPADDLLGRPLASCLVKLKESEAARFAAWCERERPAGGEVTEWEQREYFENY
jgi:glutamine synthetase